MSCDKIVEKASMKRGQHLNWDNLQSKKMSPVKVGGFGQNGQYAQKIKKIMEKS